MKGKIVICEYISTGFNYIEDVLARGFEPVLLEGHYPGTELEINFYREERKRINEKYADRLEIIKESDDYEKTLAAVKAVNPLLVIPGAEFGVPLATRLASDLRLPGNPLSRLKAMTEKDAMQAALKEKGLRYIRGQIIHSEEEAAAFYDQLGVEDIVVKRCRGGGTAGVFMCHGKEEMLAAVKQSFLEAPKDESGKNNLEIMIQEQIKGTEYIVNTVSCNGKHRIVSAWVYNKVKMSNGGNAYNYAMNISRLKTGHSRLCRYALQVVEAIGIKYGPVHGEYMIDDKGPVLIEVNCRPMGAGLQRKFTERIFAHHETDVALDSYLNPQKFEEDDRAPYRPDEFGAIKVVILAGETEVKSAPIMQIAKELKSYFSGFYAGIGQTEILHETRDLGTTGGMIYLLNKDENLVKNDCELLHLIEMKYPRIFFQNSDCEERFNTAPRDIPAVIEECHCMGATLVFSDRADEDFGDVKVTDSKNLTEAYNSYENGILDISRAESYSDLESMIQQIFVFFKKIRRGGRIIVPESTWCHLPYGIDGMEILMKAAGHIVELPLARMPELLISCVE